MDANAIATGHYASTTFGDFLENHDPVAGTLLCVCRRLLVLLSKVELWLCVEIHQQTSE
jgi:hypothetical protein